MREISERIKSRFRFNAVHITSTFIGTSGKPSRLTSQGPFAELILPAQVDRGAEPLYALTINSADLDSSSAETAGDGATHAMHVLYFQGNMTGQVRYSNLAETTVVASTSYTYDNANQLTGITDKNSGGTTLVSYGYTSTRQPGRPGDRSWASGSSTDTLTYGYTNNNQLTSVVAHEWLFLQRELQLRRQRESRQHRLHDHHRQRADRLARLLVHLRCRWQHDHDDGHVDGRRLDLFV